MKDSTQQAIRRAMYPKKGPSPEIMPRIPGTKIAGPKNKYDLSQHEIEMLASMTPKEKKVFLRARTNG